MDVAFLSCLFGLFGGLGFFVVVVVGFGLVFFCLFFFYSSRALKEPLVRNTGAVKIASMIHYQ